MELLPRMLFEKGTKQTKAAKLTLRARTVFVFFLIFEKMQVISLYWFAAQQCKI